MTLRRALMLLLALCSLTRVVLGQGASEAAPQAPRAPALPRSLGGVKGRIDPLRPEERVLAASPRVRLTRMSYGQTSVALISASGVKELHPPSVCLRAAGVEVVAQHTDKGPAGCRVVLRVQKGGRIHHFLYAYFNASTVTCSYWRHVGLSALDLLLGRPDTWSTVQVTDRDAHRAGEVLDALLARMRGARP